jgi:hypothetical protein
MSLFAVGGQVAEHTLHCVHARDVDTYLVVATLLPVIEPEMMARKEVACACSA